MSNRDNGGRKEEILEPTSKCFLQDFAKIGRIMHKRKACFSIIASAILATSGAARASAAGVATITLLSQFDYPTSPQASTEPYGINNMGAIVGLVLFPNGVIAGFKRSTSGTFAELKYPNSDGLDTEAYGINDLHEIVGSSVLPPAGEGQPFAHIGFTLASGAYTEFTGEKSLCDGSPCYTTLFNVNNPGDLVGGWFPPGSSFEQSFAILGGVFTPIANSLLGNYSTLYSINNNATEIVGTFLDESLFAHGFSYAVAGAAIKTINFPGANQTFIFGVNNHGTITGRYTDTGGVQHGIARIFGQWASYDFPGASNFTTLQYVNDNNVATGFYVDKVGLTHGFTVQIALSQAN
jgi:hypothetical protein